MIDPISMGTTPQILSKKASRGPFLASMRRKEMLRG